MSTLDSQDLKGLEQTRQRLSQLTSSLASLQHQLLTSDPLPPWNSLHSISHIIAQNLSAVSTQLATHASLLSSLAVYPLPMYPGREHETILNQLLRKKLEPRIEEWVGDGRANGTNLESRGGKQDIKDFWEWAMQEANEQARKQPWEGEFTLEEVQGGTENVITGLKRSWYEESDSDEEEDGSTELAKSRGKNNHKEEVRPLNVDDFLRFMARGVEPVKEDPDDTSKKAQMKK